MIIADVWIGANKIFFWQNPWKRKPKKDSKQKKEDEMLKTVNLNRIEKSSGVLRLRVCHFPIVVNEMNYWAKENEETKAFVGNSDQISRINLNNFSISICYGHLTESHSTHLNLRQSATLRTHDCLRNRTIRTRLWLYFLLISFSLQVVKKSFPLAANYGFFLFFFLLLFWHSTPHGVVTAVFIFICHSSLKRTFNRIKFASQKAVDFPLRKCDEIRTSEKNVFMINCHWIFDGRKWKCRWGFIKYSLRWLSRRNAFAFEICGTNFLLYLLAQTR